MSDAAPIAHRHMPPAPVRRAMVLAAGLGLRLRPITETLPKPLVPVAGRTLLDRALDRLEEAGVDHIVVNVHYRADQIERHITHRRGPRIALSSETELLETGGGVLQALPLLGADPFYVINSDVILLNGPRDALTALAEAWDESRMDALLLLHPTFEAFGADGIGDFTMDQWGLLSRRCPPLLAPYLFTGVQILHPRLFRDPPEPPFSLNHVYNRAMASARLYGILHDGKWFHVGRPEDLAAAETYLARQHSGVRRT